MSGRYTQKQFAIQDIIDEGTCSNKRNPRANDDCPSKIKGFATYSFNKAKLA